MSSTARAAALPTRFTELVGVEYPIVQTGMGWVSGPALTSATSNAGGLGILASATMTYAELEAAISKTKSLTDKPFGVNIRADATDAEIAQALDVVGAGPWVAGLSDGLATLVGAGGVVLDPGQAQQVALARIVLMDPATLILDEATSLLDPAVARSAERAIDAVLADRTVIAIAHRLDTAAVADRVAVIIDGRIVELGPHDELVAAGGEYTKLWEAWSSR